MDTIGSRVRELRKKQGYTMMQLHKITGISTGNISDIENNRYFPAVPALIPLSQALQCSIDWLLTGKNSETRLSEFSGMDTSLPHMTDDEVDLLTMYRLLDIRDKEDLFELARLKYSRANGEKMASVFSTYAVASNRSVQSKEKNESA